MNEEDNPYLPSDPNFRFVTGDPLHKINWRQIGQIDFKQLRYGNCNLNLTGAYPSTYEEQQQLQKPTALS